MTQVLEHSCNTGMTFISKKLGASLFYSYLKAFGFTERTNMGLNDEVLGKLAYYESWTESEMATKAFGQGISITPMQLAQAYTSIFNNGTMMKPYLVKSIEYASGEIEDFEPTAVRQVVSAETAQKVTAMMTDVVESYATISIPDHYFAGKSGTAQTYQHGVALSGVGTTEATFIGAGPVADPEFLVIVKMDRPRASQWAEGTSGQVLKKVMAYLYDYYSMPPDKEGGGTPDAVIGGLSTD
jgi:cell division protein FtsI/penicillin-binding protein 2